MTFRNLKITIIKFIICILIFRRLCLDPFDSKKSAELWGVYQNIRQYGYSVVPDSSLFFWDAHYGPNEGGIPLDLIKSDINFRLIKSFSPKEPFMVLGNKPFEIYVFQKIKSEDKLIEIVNEKKYDFEIKYLNECN